MASIGGKLFYPSSSSSLPRNKSNQMFSSNPILPVSRKVIPFASITSSSHQGVVSWKDELLSDSHWKDDDFLGKIDSWMHGSVTEIVKNLKQAPLLVRIYSEYDGRVEIQTEKAVLERWPVVKCEWRSGGTRSPDGLIFVEELEDQENEEENLTKAWGIVVQGKGAECGPACYLLKTSRVCSGLGLGFCTHFCLMKVNNFRDTALEQFKDSWLLQ